MTSPWPVATLAGGCFWCLEAAFQQLDGVISVVPGYMGGQDAQPTYEAICRGHTGHAEVVQIRFDPERIDFAALLDVFFTIHDPTTLNRQGHDVGTQYRSAIFWHDEAQREMALATIAALNAAGYWPSPIVTEVVPATDFFVAEDYHHDYFRNNPQQGYCMAVVAPKALKVRARFGERLKPEFR